MSGPEMTEQEQAELRDLAALWRTSQAEDLPPAAVTAQILAAARASVAPARPRPKMPRWVAGLALAASLIAGFAVVLQLPDAARSTTFAVAPQAASAPMALAGAKPAMADAAAELAAAPAAPEQNASDADAFAGQANPRVAERGTSRRMDVAGEAAPKVVEPGLRRAFVAQEAGVESHAAAIAAPAAEMALTPMAEPAAAPSVVIAKAAPAERADTAEATEREVAGYAAAEMRARKAVAPTALVMPPQGLGTTHQAWMQAQPAPSEACAPEVLAWSQSSDTTWTADWRWQCPDPEGARSVWHTQWQIRGADGEWTRVETDKP